MWTRNISTYAHMFIGFRRAVRAILVLLLLFAVGCQGSGQKPAGTTDDPLGRMVDKQIVARGITDERVIDAMKKVPRGEFVPSEYRNYAYNDSPLPIGHDQTISQPYIVALMTEELKLDDTHRVLEIGTGSGYQAAILAEIAKEVFTIEIIGTLGLAAEERLERLGYDNVHVMIGDGYEGWPEHAPFDRIIVTCAPTDIPGPLKRQLAVDGRMVIPSGPPGFQNLYLVRKSVSGVDTLYDVEKVIPVSFVPLTGPHAE